MKIKDEIGFTYIELLMVLMIISIGAAVAAPNFGKMIKNYKLTNAARMVWLDVHKARTLAIKQGQTMRVDFTTTSYSIVRVDTGALVFSRNLNARAYRGLTIDTNTTASVSFGTTGTANGSTVVIKQGSAGSKSFTIALTGRIGKIS
jgi:prepilin-type N-terminal cleavage/methylation domain-containing protein